MRSSEFSIFKGLWTVALAIDDYKIIWNGGDHKRCHGLKLTADLAMVGLA